MWAPRAGRVSISLPGMGVTQRRVKGEGNMTVAVPFNGTAAKHEVTAHVTFRAAGGHSPSVVKFAVRG